MRKLIFATLAVTLVLGFSGRGGLFAAQSPQAPQSPPRARDLPGQGERVFGTIASVGVDRFEVKKPDGTTQTLRVDDQTRYRQGRQEIQLEDLKTGDRILVRGRTDVNKEFVALLVRRLTEEEIARFQNAGERVFGELVSIEKNQLKVRNRFQGERIVVVDDQTVYAKERQPITLKDLKVGDFVFAVGKESNGQFVASRVVTGSFQAFRQDRRLEGEGDSQNR